MINGLDPLGGGAGLALPGTFSSQTLSVHIFINHKQSRDLWRPSRDLQQVKKLPILRLRAQYHLPLAAWHCFRNEQF